MPSWTKNSEAVLSIINGALKIKNSTDTSLQGVVYQTVTGLISGKQYTFSWKGLPDGDPSHYVKIGSTSGGDEMYNKYISLSSTQTFTQTITAIGTNMYIQLRVGNSTNWSDSYCIYDNISIIGP